MKTPVYSVISLLTIGAAFSSGALVWQVGIDDNAWPVGDGGGPNATFVQEAGVNALPGVPNSPETNQQADDDYYFAGLYSTQVDGGPAYTPVGAVVANEEAAERAFAGTDNSLRYHFNLPGTVSPTDLLSVTFDALNLDGNGADPRYGIEVYFNNVQVMSEVIINQAAIDADTDYTTPTFSAASVNAQIGAGFDNYVELRGINHNADAISGGSWMGIDYVQLNADPIPEPSPLGLALLAGAGVFMVRRARRK